MGAGDMLAHLPAAERCPATRHFAALTRAPQLVVIVGQKRAVYLGMRDWRRAPRHTALGGLLEESLRFGGRP